MNRYDEVTFVHGYGETRVHILIGDDDLHHGLSLCGEQRVFLDDKYHQNASWLTVKENSTVLGDLCHDCFSEAGRLAAVAL